MASNKVETRVSLKPSIRFYGRSHYLLLFDPIKQKGTMRDGIMMTIIDRANPRGERWRILFRVAEYKDFISSLGSESEDPFRLSRTYSYEDGLEVSKSFTAETTNGRRGRTCTVTYTEKQQGQKEEFLVNFDLDEDDLMKLESSHNKFVDYLFQ